MEFILQQRSWHLDSFEAHQVQNDAWILHLRNPENETGSRRGGHVDMMSKEEAMWHHLRREVPPEVLAVSPVPSNPRHHNGGRSASLPLNIIAQIISYVDDVADIARLTRTARLLYFMALPQLYAHITLRSHAELRYVDGKPVGYGSGSPLTMALSGLTTGNSGPLVNHFDIQGLWMDARAAEYNQGKVPDSTMLLGIALRAAIDKMTCLKSFRWELDTKPPKTVYQGLALRSTLTSLDMTFPSTRAPRPTITLPPIPSLRKLRLTNIDPLCYPDDISVLLLHSKKLEDLRLHWTPRMRMEAESSLSLRTYFGKCFEAKYKIPLKHMAMHNYFGVNTGELADISDPETMRSSDFINCFGGSNSGPAAIFVDETWRSIPNAQRNIFRNFKRWRISDPHEHHAGILTSYSGMEEFYIVSSHLQPPFQNGVASLPRPDVCSTPKSTSSSGHSPSRVVEQADAHVTRLYLHSIVSFHGHTMRKLLLDKRWAISGHQLADLVSGCPNLEQLGLGLSDDEPNAMRILTPFLKNMMSLRILHNEWLDKAMAMDPELRETMSDDGPDPALWDKPLTSKIRYVGIGDKIFRVGETVQVPDGDGRLEWKKEVWRATLDDVKHIEIWNMDCLEI